MHRTCHIDSVHVSESYGLVPPARGQQLRTRGELPAQSGGRTVSGDGDLRCPSEGTVPGIGSNGGLKPPDATTRFGNSAIWNAAPGSLCAGASTPGGRFQSSVQRRASPREPSRLRTVRERSRRVAQGSSAKAPGNRFRQCLRAYRPGPPCGVCRGFVTEAFGGSGQAGPASGALDALSGFSNGRDAYLSINAHFPLAWCLRDGNEVQIKSSSFGVRGGRLTAN
jgi:hypothetical protein